jgi:hypothetical protein
MLTPRNYLSWSQLNLFEKSPERYVRKYLFGEDLKTNQGQKYGKLLSEGLEKNEFTGDVALDLIIDKIPKLEEKEYRVEVEMKNGKEKIPLFIVLDTAQRDLTAFKEYKTGQILRAMDAFGQMTFYSTAIKLKTGKIPKDREWVGIQTKKRPDGRIEGTGEIYRQQIVITELDCLRMMVRIKKAWLGIQKLTAQEWL